MKFWKTSLAGFLVLIAGCSSEDGQPQRSRGQDRDAALPVKTEDVEVGEITSFIETHARLEAERWVEVVSRVQGLAERLSAEEGDAVRAGQILIELQKDELRLEVEQARVSLDQAKTSFERAQALHTQRLVSQEAFESASNAVESAQVALDRSKLQLDYADVRAPIDGVVMERLLERGDLVHANDVVFVVADLEPLQARIHVPEKRMTQIRTGQEAWITVDSEPDRRFPATVRRINPGVDPSSGTVKVTLDVPPAEGALRSGMFATVRIVTDRRNDTFLIPKKALVLETDEDDVFSVREGKAERVRIEIGYTDGDRVEVLSGLALGDRVITVGHEGIKDGAAVRVVGEAGQESETRAAAPGNPSEEQDKKRPGKARRGGGE